MLIEVWYHKVMNEKSIHAPFVPEQQKFCSARKLPGGRFPKKCLEKLYKIAHRNGAPERQRRSGALKSFSREGLYEKTKSRKSADFPDLEFKIILPLKMRRATRSA